MVVRAGFPSVKTRDAWSLGHSPEMNWTWGVIRRLHGPTFRFHAARRRGVNLSDDLSGARIVIPDPQERRDHPEVLDRQTLPNRRNRRFEFRREVDDAGAARQLG